MKLSENAGLADWLAHMDSQSWRTGDMKLDRLTTMLERLRLEKPAPYIITVAGTNGKGTTCYTSERILLAHGKSVGTTISPHIDRYNERIRVNGEEASDATIVDAFKAVEALRGDIPLSYFEYSVLASFWIFVQAQVEVAILEIGLGGRLDGFNVVAADTAVITSIGLDHQALLGDDLESIGAEKAGILRPGQSVVLGRDMPESVLARCRELGLEPQQIPQNIEVEAYAERCSISTAEFQLSDLSLASVAPHNLALALAATANVVTLNEKSVRAALSQLRIRGRMEMRRWRGRMLVLDVAHNPAGVRFLFEQLAEREIKPSVICCAMLQDKDHLGVYRAISERFQGRWLFIDSRGDRAMRAKDVNAAMGNVGRCLVADEAAAGTADIEAFLDSETSVTDVILGLGSFSLVEQLLIGVSEHA